MLKIRLQRVGRKNEPVFRLVVTDSQAGPKAGKAVEILGSYDPRFNKSSIKSERVKHWMSVGAQVSGTVNNLLINEQIIEGKKVNVLPKKTPIKKETKATEDSTPEEVKSAEGELPEEVKPEDSPTESEVKEEEKAEENKKPEEEIKIEVGGEVKAETPEVK